MSELNPCPFCGGQAIMKIQKHIPNGYDYTPTCQDPSCAGRLTKKWVNEADAIEAWNKRMCADHFREVTKMMDATDTNVGDKDLISRQEAIDAIENSEFGYTYEVDTALDVIKSLPSAEPERKKGKWIEQDDGWYGTYYECSCCKEAFSLIDGTPADNLYNFCPNCGADMRGDR